MISISRADLISNATRPFWMRGPVLNGVASAAFFRVAGARGQQVGEQIHRRAP